MHRMKRLIGIGAVVALTVLIGCRSESRRLEVRIVDSEGEPIVGAIFYAEAFTYEANVFDFVWGTSDSAGQVYDAHGTSLEIAWKSDARLAHAAFAPAMTPAGFIDHIGRATDSTFDVILYDTSQTDLDYQPVLGKLGFPFEDNPELAGLLEDPSNHGLLVTFRDAYAPIASGMVSSMPEEQAKLAFLEKLLDRAALQDRP